MDITATWSHIGRAPGITVTMVRRNQRFGVHCGRLVGCIAVATTIWVAGAAAAEGPTSIAVDEAADLYSADGLSIVKYTRDGRVKARWR